MTKREIENYHSNALLKKAGQPIEWTSEMVHEYVRCVNDPIYFAETYMKIISLDEGLIAFKLRDYQKKMILSMRDNRFTCVTASRQCGKTTVVCAMLLWYVIFHEDKTVALLANKGDVAREILGRIELAYQHLPLWIQQGVTEWNKGSFCLENNSRIIACSTSSDAIRGFSVSFIFIDEAAQIANWSDFSTSVLPTISSGKETKVVMVSTPFGLNHFYSIWKGAVDKKNDYNPIMVTWRDVPGRDDKWRNETIRLLNGDVAKFEQENECCFQGSSGTLISGAKLSDLTSTTVNPEMSKDGLMRYVPPVPDHSYCIVVDVSRGKGLDYSAFQVIDITRMPYEQVCTYRSNSVTPIDYCEVVNLTGRAYNKAAVLVEINDIGEQVSTSLHYEYEYENLLYTVGGGPHGKQVTGGFTPLADHGIRTTRNVKSIGCSLLKLLIEQDQLILRDMETVYELSTFSKKGPGYEAETGKHDDLVMGLVLFSWLSDQRYFKEMTGLNTLQELRDKTSASVVEDLMPFGFVSDGGDEEEMLNDEAVASGNWLFPSKEALEAGASAEEEWELNAFRENGFS